MMRKTHEKYFVQDSNLVFAYIFKISFKDFYVISFTHGTGAKINFKSVFIEKKYYKP